MKKWFIVICLCWGAVINADDNFKKANRLDTDALNKIIADKNPHFVEDFNDKKVLNKKWIVSTAKKEGIEADLAAYDGDWLIEAPMKYALLDDFGLLFKQRAKHRAISALLKKDFVFEDTPFVLQYEVHFQEGQECGGGYIKLVSGDRSTIKLHEFHDKTPYTIMFGPDKCGSTSKLHFIFRHKNPLNGSFEEKHMKPMANRIDEIFSDGKPHLFGLVLLPDNSYKILIDHKVVNEGSLLNDFTPPVNPPAEIDDPTDIKPENWDDREMIPDPLATKPVDWDEDAPATIQDPLAVKPDSWLDHEPLYISDPSAEKPHDWDAEMDGEWEAPLVPNPACEDAAGCGDWTPPSISNPSYKGKWTPPLIPNPDYKGKWTPRKIPNADYFEDKTPFKMAKIVAVGFELWSMSPSILFDNILLTDSEEFARMWAKITYDVKIQNIEQSAKTLKSRILQVLHYKPGWWALYFTYCLIPVAIYGYYLVRRVQEDTFINQFIVFTNRYPWLWAMYTVLLLILVTLIVYCCFWNVKDNYEHKKSDAILPDDSVQSDDSAQSEELIQSGTSSDQPAEETKSSVETDIAEVVSSESDMEADATESQGENEKTIEGGVDI